MKKLVVICGLIMGVVLSLGAQDKEKESKKGTDAFLSMPIPDTVFARMQGRSYPEGCSVRRSDLRYLRLWHYGFDGKTHVGELVCNVAIANDLLTIFKQLYEQRYPIERMRLIDDYGADDERAMRANNSSCFCYRKVKGHAKLSAHARGMAVDLNPFYNPYYRQLKDGKEVVQPATARKYCDRTQNFPYKITPADPAYKLFRKYGFKWGGSWRSVKDYQHFEK